MYVPKQQDRIEEGDYRFCSCEVSSVQVNTDGFQHFEKKEKIYICVCMQIQTVGSRKIVAL